MRRFFINGLIGIVCVLLFLLSFSIPVSTHAKQKPLKLSLQAQIAINNLAKNILFNGNNPRITALKPQLDPQDYASVKDIKILPDNPLYAFVTIGRKIRLFFIVNQVGKASQRLHDGNEKTLESLLLIEKNFKEKDAKKQQRLIAAAAKTIDAVGGDFDTVAQIIDDLNKKKSPQAFILEEEAFRFAGYYLKHQILLQQQEDALSEKDFLTVESARIKHLKSLAHIVVSENRSPLIFGQKLSQLLSPQVGSNFKTLATIALLRDLEYNATEAEQKSLQKAQAILRKEFEAKLAKLSTKERLNLVKRYIGFIHGNPVRQFQAYNQLSKRFTSYEMAILTSAFKDKAAQNFKKHLQRLDTANQKQFVSTLFSTDPIDMRLVFYTQVQLRNDQYASNKEKSEKAKVTLARLDGVKKLLQYELCTSATDSQALAKTRFYTQAPLYPDILDVRIRQFLNQTIQGCPAINDQAVSTVGQLQQKINNGYIKNIHSVLTGKSPTKTAAEEILKTEDIQATGGEEQQVAEKVEQEVEQIEEELSQNPMLLEQVVNTVEETIPVDQTETSKSIQETVVDEGETIIEETIQTDAPTTEDIVEKEKQIIEEIVDAAETGETSPLVEDLPTQVQEEIHQETGTTAPPASEPVSEPDTSSSTTEPVVNTDTAPAVESPASESKPTDNTAPAPEQTVPQDEPSVPSL